MSKLTRIFFHALFARFFFVLLGVLFAGFALATTSPITLSGINTNVTKGVGQVASILQDIATVAGIGFIFSSFFKFHQHKQNPTQVPLSQGITLLVIGAALAVFPHLIGTVSKGVFGTSVTPAGGTAIRNIVAPS